MGSPWLGARQSAEMQLHLSLLVISLVSTQAWASLQKFEEFKQRFNKNYLTWDEEESRYSTFLYNLEQIEKHNAGASSYKKGLNSFSDLTQSEWEAMYLGGYKRISVNNQGAQTDYGNLLKTEDLPESKDWRDEGVISAVKNQGRCGSCWAFATTEQIESYIALGSEPLVELSAQQVTSCTPNPLTCGGSGGCEGSTPPLGYNYVQLFGQVKEEDYPYISGDTADSEECNYDLDSLQPVATITGYNNLPQNDQAAVMNHIANVGPLAISVAASPWKDYESGVFSGCPYEENIQNNHAVQLVGYGSEGGVDYWLVRNSWGADWGEEGYIKMLREAEPGCGLDTSTSGHVCQGGPGNDVLHVCGMCGMLLETSYPLGAHLL